MTDKQAFIQKVRSLGTISSVTGKVYCITSVSPSYITGIRLSTDKPFRITTDKLYAAFTDLSEKGLPITTSILKAYVDRTQSPSLAILNVLKSIE